MRDFREQNFYELLEVKPHASPQELERSYRRARRFFSSDSVATYALFRPDELNLLRRRIEEAYRVLSDPERRRMYDRELAALQGDGVRAGPTLRADEPVQQDERPAVQEVPGQVSLLPDNEHTEGKPGPVAGPADPAAGAEKAAEEKAAEEKAAGQAAAGEEPSDVAQPEQTDAAGAEPGPDERAEDEGQTLPDAGEPKMPEEESGLEPEAVAEEPDETTQQPAVPPMPEITGETVVDGILMRQVREARGISLHEIADITKIAIYYLRNLEENQFDDLPAPVYVRGYLRQIAAILELDTEWFAGRFLDLIKEKK